MLDLLVGERGGRLVHHDQVGVGGQGAGNRDQGLLPWRQATHRNVERDGGAETVEHGLRLGAQRPPAYAAPPRPRIGVSQKDILGGVEVGNEVQFLMDEGQSQPCRIAHVVQSGRLAAHQNLATVARSGAGQQLDQR